MEAPWHWMTLLKDMIKLLLAEPAAPSYTQLKKLVISIYFLLDTQAPKFCRKQSIVQQDPHWKSKISVFSSVSQKAQYIAILLELTRLSIPSCKWTSVNAMLSSKAPAWLFWTALSWKFTCVLPPLKSCRNSLTDWCLSLNPQTQAYSDCYLNAFNINYALSSSYAPPVQKTSLNQKDVTKLNENCF